MELIVELHNEYKPTTVMVSHDLRRLIPVVTRVLALFDGTIVFDGSVDQLVHASPTFVRSFVACRYEMNQEGSVSNAPV
jgi:ABC-type transporter Mla maintaining outer membrane lipid asymmetry ATPase subunit MlaF